MKLQRSKGMLKHRRENADTTAFVLRDIFSYNKLEDALDILGWCDSFNPADVLNASRESGHVQLILRLRDKEKEEGKIIAHYDEQLKKFFDGMAVDGENFDVDYSVLDISEPPTYRIDVYRTVTTTTRPMTIERV